VEVRIVSFVRAGFGNVFYDVAGPAGAPVVAFGNSLGTNVHVWDAVYAAFVERFRVLRFDMRGHGLTETGAGTDMAALASDVVALLDALDIPRVHYVGLSIGGMIGQRLAAEYPTRVDSLVLTATANRIGSESVWDDRIAAANAGGMSALVDGVLARWFTPETHRERPELIRGYASMLSRTPVEGYVAACAAIRDADLAADDARIACPTLAIAGARDLVTPPGDAYALRDAIRDAKCVVIDGAAHIVPAERPAAFIDAAIPFLEARVPALGTP
jgi:3-oxoadipate enol-lactonase